MQPRSKNEFAVIWIAAVVVLMGTLASTFPVIAADPPKGATEKVTTSSQPASQPVGGDYIWWEAESFKESNWPGGSNGTGPFSPQNEEQKGMISGGIWLNGVRLKEAPFAVYEIEVPVEGEYTFWARMFSQYGGGVRNPFRYKFDDGEWVEQKAGTGTALHSVKPQQNSTLAWLRFGKVRLTAGRHTFRLEVLNPDDAVGVDCLVLARRTFQPNGTLKPGEKLGLAMDGYWAFEPNDDDFSSQALLDLSYLNHTPAGKFGYVTKSPDGNDFFLNGQPLRFWSVELGTGGLELEDLERHARFLAKRGVNAVRYFEFIDPKSPDSKVTDIDEEVMHRAWKVVAAMKKHGIYVMITPLWTFELNIQRSWGLRHHPAPPGVGRKKPDGAFFVEPDLRAAYKGWMKKYLLTPNPYTGIPLAKDPAVYCIQVHNENSYFFYTYMYGCERGALKEFSKLFGDWLIKKYGSLDQAQTAWGGEVKEPGNDLFPGDDYANGYVGLPAHLHSLTSGYLLGWKKKHPEPTSHDLRMRDYLQFLAEHMRGVYQEMTDFYRNDIGYKGLISANNWKSRDPLTLDDVERWTYTAGDVMDRHHYVNGGAHLNPKDPSRVGYQVNNGDYFGDRSLLLDSRVYLPTHFKMVAGFPSMVSESTWVSPMSHQAEGPLLIACYGALTGLDMFNWFRIGTIGWDSSLQKWQAAIPAIQGGFPAAALIYRQGLVKEAEPVVYTERKLTDLWDMKFPVIAEDPTYDPNVNAKFVNEKINIPGGVGSLAFLVGPVQVKYEGDPSRNKVADLAKYINNEKKTVQSMTGELMVDHGSGLFTVNAPKAQGAAGFLSKAGDLKLADVTISSQDEYASVVVVPLDDLPIARSKKLLVQVGTINRPYKWEEKAATFDVNLGQKNAKPDLVEGKQIVSLGSSPWNVKRTHISLTVRNPGLTQATLLDANGLAQEKVPCQCEKGELTVQLPPQTMYVILQ